jgi:hypothetical protein
MEKYISQMVEFSQWCFNNGVETIIGNTLSYGTKGSYPEEWIESAAEKIKKNKLAGNNFAQVPSWAYEILESELEKENAHLAEKIRSNIMRLLPVSTQFNLGINTSISSWRQLLIRASDFLSEDEMRYIFLNLAREFKTRYYSLFQDCVLEDIAGKQYGLDTLRTEDKAWYKYKLKFKLEG